MFVQALVLSFESIFVELLTDLPRISALLVSSVSIPIAGAISLLIPFIYERKITVFNSSKLLIAGSIILAAAVFLWYDSVSRVGASKEGLLAGPLETVVVLNLAWLLLKEKLVKTQLVGVIIALSGFFAAALSQSSQLNSALVVVITFGDVEAMVSAVAFAAGVIIMTRLVERHTPVEVSGASLLISGLILAGILVLSRVQVSTPSVPQWIYLITFSLLPLFAALLYVIGLYSKKPTEWTDQDVLRFCKTTGQRTKPIIIAANKADLQSANSVITAMKSNGAQVFPCSGEAESMLRKAAKQGLLRYLPGDKSFETIAGGSLNDAQKRALGIVESLLHRHGSTGVQEIINHVCFCMLKLIVVYPVEDELRLTDKKGNILPDARLIPQDSTAKDLARLIHEDLAKGFLYAIDVRNKHRIGAEHKLKHSDVIKIVSTTSIG